MTRIQPFIAIDGVFFQINGKSGIARVWRSLLQEWVLSGFAQHLLVLDRDGTAPRIPGINYQLIHRYEWDDTLEDSLKLQEICDQYQVDLFISTYYTQPISIQAIFTPTLLLIHDMIPEKIGADLTLPTWQEKHYAICYAYQYIVISHNTKNDLCYFYPKINPSNIRVACNGLDPLFIPSSEDEIGQFMIGYGINHPYFLIVGDRVGLDGYKNAIHSFRAISKIARSQQLEIVCVGGNERLETELTSLVVGIKVHRLSLSDWELQAAYSGALALIYPSRYEGFGLPVLEAMACGCPVITCNNSSLPEVAGAAAIYVSETDVAELVAALEQVQQPEVRSQLITAGLTQCQQFSWTKMASTIAQVTIDAHADSQAGKLKLSLDPSVAELRQLKSQLMVMQKQLTVAQGRITWMETSKFWQLRQRWFQLKKWLRLVDDSK
jgi:glycosyltransferase involved in cell wall biosynthesis